jgi:CRISPR/Cas system-associated endonuclease Cas3-HD
MIAEELDRQLPNYFCSTQFEYLPAAVENSARMKVQFKNLLENYRKEGLLGNQLKNLSNTLDAIDTVFEAFEHLSVESPQKDNLVKAFALLTSVKSIFVYKAGG